MFGATVPREGGDSRSSLSFWGQHGGSHRAEPCWGPWWQHSGCAWLRTSSRASAALAGAAGRLAVRGCGRAGCQSRGCRGCARAGRSPPPKSQPCPVAFLQPVFNKLSWVFLVLFLITAILLSLFPFSPPSPSPVAPPCLGSPNAPHPPARPRSHSGGSKGVLARWLPCPI